MNINTIRESVQHAFDQANSAEELDTVTELVNGVINDNRSAFATIRQYPLAGCNIRGLQEHDHTRYKQLYLEMVNLAVSRYGFHAVHHVVSSVNLRQAQSKLTLNTLLLDMGEKLDALETNAFKKLSHMFNTKNTISYLVNAAIYPTTKSKPATA